VVTRKRAPKPELRNVAAILNRESPAVPDQPDQSVQTTAIEQIHLPAKQPRRFFDPDKLAQLVQSVKEHGILEPLLVRPLENGDYELVAGERRLRAAREVGLSAVPIVVHELDDRQALQVALLENLQREDLNPIEETDAVLDLLMLALDAEKKAVISLFYQAHRNKHRGQELGQNVLSQLKIVQEVIDGIGRFTLDSFRSSRLPLLNLPDDVLGLLRQGRLEYTKAQAIAGNLSLSEIKERKKALEPPTEPAPEKAAVERLSDIGKRLQKPQAWGDRKKRDRIAKLLDELERLTRED
jgi:ParB family chromosome partitioning protein